LLYINTKYVKFLTNKTEKSNQKKVYVIRYNMLQRSGCQNGIYIWMYCHVIHIQHDVKIIQGSGQIDNQKMSQ